MTTKTVSSGSVFKAFVTMGTARASSEGTTLDETEARVALDTFKWTDQKVTRAEVIAAQKEFDALTKNGKLNPGAAKVFTDWFAAVGTGEPGGFTYERSASTFDNLESFLRFNPDSQKGPIFTKSEAQALVGLMGASPSPSRIVDVAELRGRVKQGDAHEVLDAWLEAHPMPTPAGPLNAKLAEATTGLLWPSETDRVIYPVRLGAAPSARQSLPNALRTALNEGSKVPVEQVDFAQQFARLTEVNDPSDPGSVERAGRFEALQKVLTENLTDLHVFRLGGVRKDVYVLGKDAAGQWVGVMSGVVET